MPFINIDVTGRAIEAAAAFTIDATDPASNGRKHHADIALDLDAFFAAVMLHKSHLRHPRASLVCSLKEH
ncbi:hypothetical protein XH88_17740 [Bradyrhizobium sp. CCBAU 51627]|nr:hypothetical protein [Bradyrhizobium sp. CCBAU 51627]